MCCAEICTISFCSIVGVAEGGILFAIFCYSQLYSNENHKVEKFENVGFINFHKTVISGNGTNWDSFLVTALL